MTESDHSLKDGKVSAPGHQDNTQPVSSTALCTVGKKILKSFSMNKMLCFVFQCWNLILGDRVYHWATPPAT